MQILKDVTVHMMIKNGEKYCRQAVSSIAPYLGKIIIVDTGSIDKTPEYLLDLKKKFDNIELRHIPTADSIIWDGKHLNQALTDIRNFMVSLTTTRLIMQLDDDEIYSLKTLKELAHSIEQLETHYKDVYAGIQVPIKWCVSEKEYVEPGPFPKTLRVFKNGGDWRGKFPDEFYYFNNQPVHMMDPRCHTLKNGFLHMSMVIHPERRPINGMIHTLSDEERDLISNV